MSPSLPVLGSRRFGCTGCGECCRRPGFVYLGAAEVIRIADHLGMDRSALVNQLGLTVEPSHGSYVFEALPGRPCPLLLEDGRCGVHPVKPIQCRTFPFWEEILDDEREWEAARSYCEGIDHPEGRLYTAAEMRRLRTGYGST